MNENELIAMERVVLSARSLVVGIDSSGVNTYKLLSNLKRDIGLLDSIRQPAPLPTAKDIIQQEINRSPIDASTTGMAGDIHQALVEAGYL